jgi:putative colanic acid biosynthesis acetyltransferase WcaF
VSTIVEIKAEAPVMPAVRLDRPYFSMKNRMGRFCWGIVYSLFFRTTLRPFHAWRSWLLKAFGARLGRRCHIYPGAIIWAPWNLECGDDVAIADGAEIYNTSTIKLGDGAIISQRAYLCGASHDPDDQNFPLLSAPIIVEKGGWVASRSIVMLGVTVGEGCVIGAGSVVTKSMPKGAICAGNPCRVIKTKEDRLKLSSVS